MILLLLIFVFLFVFFGLVVFLGAPYVPSQKKYVVRAFEHFGVNTKDTVVDVGSGDGIILRIASSFGARAVGYEINPFLVFISRLLSIRDTRVKVLLQNFWFAHLPNETTIVYAFAVTRDGPKLSKLLQSEANRLGKPLRLICFGSKIRGVEPDETFEPCHLYIFHPLQLKNA